MADGGIALFGGSFNPIHHGHLIVARAVAETLHLSRVVLMPSANPPHKPDRGLADADHRLEMARLAVGSEPVFEVSDLEIRRSGPSYTILTIEAYLPQLAPGQQLYWIIGGDTLPELHTWYRVRDLVKLCRIVTAVRPGFEVPDVSALEATLPPEEVRRLRDGILPTPSIDISATQIRQRIEEGRSVRYLVPDAVDAYIRTQALYRKHPV